MVTDANEIERMKYTSRRDMILFFDRDHIISDRSGGDDARMPAAAENLFSQSRPESNLETSKKTS
jgi:hypothetical protein